MTVPDQPTDHKVEGQQFDQPIQLTAAPTEPHHGLYQPYYPLSEADFMRLGQRSTAAAAIGSALTAYGVSQGLPLVVLALKHALPANIETSDWLIPLITTTVGVVALVVALTFSLERWRVTRRIRQYFRDNPGQAVVVRKGDI